MVHSAEGTRAIALELCREFEDKFLLHIAGGEVSQFYYCPCAHLLILIFLYGKPGKNIHPYASRY